MDFDDHDDHDEEEEEEIGDLPGGGSSYGTPPPQQQHSNSTTRTAPISTKQDQTTVVGSGHRKSSSGSSGGRYRECLKNHAVGIGGHAVDGCGEFMAAGEEGTLDALKCAACNCHRNFHRKEVEGVGVGFGLLGISDAAGGGGNPTSAFHHPQQHQFPPYYRTPAGYLHHHHHHPVSALHQRSIAPAPLALPSTSGGGGSRDDQEDMSDPMVGASGGVISGGGGGGGSSTGGPSKKRFRTKFTQEQKDRMLELAEKLGWRMQKHDEAAVQQFCSDTGVQRHVLKVWMHNNKHTLGKSPTPTASLIHQIPQVIHLQERQVIHHHHHQQQHHQMGPADAEDRNIT